MSHSDMDRPLAQKLSAILAKAGLDVWDEENQILPGDNWAEKVGKALRESEAMVVLVTPAALESTAVRREIQYALGEERTATG